MTRRSKRKSSPPSESALQSRRLLPGGGITERPRHLRRLLRRTRHAHRQRRKQMTDLTPELLRQLLRYEPETGRFYWKERTPAMFAATRMSSEANSKIWNTKHSGRQTFTTNNGQGYLTASIFGRETKAHHVAFALTHGRWPRQQIDHINGIRSDNRASNLREVTVQENARNRGLSKANSSGASGVHWHKRDKSWYANIRADGRRKYLGSFSSLEEAKECRRKAEMQAGYHSNHGQRQANRT